MGNVDPASHGGSSGGASSSPEQNYDDDAGVCKETEQFESKAAQSCPLAEPPPKPKREDCQATSLVISKKLSNKSGVRKIEIKRGGPGHSDDPSNSPPPRLEIVSGCFDDTWLQDLIAKHPSKVECKAVISGGPCKDGGTGRSGGSSRVCAVRGHKGSTYDVDFEVKSRSDTDLVFEPSAFGHLLPWWAQPRVYEVRFNTCSDSFVGEVAVYPDVEFGIGFEYKHQKQVDTGKANEAKVDLVRKVDVPARNPSGNSKQRRKARRAEPERWTPRMVQYDAMYVESKATETKITKNLSIFGMLKIAGMEVNYKGCFKSHMEKIKSVADIAEQAFSVLKILVDYEKESVDLKEMEKQSNADLKKTHTEATLSSSVPRRTKQSITYPSVLVKMSGLWLELEDSEQCACCMRLAVALKPLIGMSYTWDLTPMVLRAFGALTGGSSAVVAEVWSRLQAWLQKQGIDAFRVELIIEGSLEGEVMVDIASGSDWNVTAPIDVNLKGRIEATLAKMKFDKKKLGIRVMGDIDLGLKGETGFRVRAEFMTEGTNGVYGSLEWTGIKVTIAMKWRTCVTTTECKPPSNKEDPEELSWTMAGVKSDRVLMYSFEDNH